MKRGRVKRGGKEGVAPQRGGVAQGEAAAKLGQWVTLCVSVCLYILLSVFTTYSAQMYAIIERHW